MTFQVISVILSLVIRLQKLEKPAIGGGCRGPSPFSLSGTFCSEVHMSKPFITYTAQIEKLKTEKNLIITDTDFAVESLQNISYYALIGGYKHPFIDIHTRKYINDACFEDIVALYEFDEELRGIFFKYLCRVERKMRSSISYHFCKKHGERQKEYLNSNNYSNISKNKNGITKLIKMLDMMANKNRDHEYLVYQRNKYHNIPLWVIMNTLTFGQISKMFEFLPQNMQGTICQDFGNVKKNEMIKYLKVLTLYRNVCAHNERLSSHSSIHIPNIIKFILIKQRWKIFIFIGFKTHQNLFFGCFFYR